MLRSLLFFLAGVIATQYCAAGEHELIQDPSFIDGYEVISPVREKYKRKAIIGSTHTLYAKSQKPSWRLAQWGSKKDLSGVPAEYIPDGPVSWSYIDYENDKPIVYKKVAIQPGYPMSDGSMHSSLILELNGLAEFSAINADRKIPQKKSIYLTSHHDYWPHLLMMQELDSGHLDAYKSLVLKLDARLLFDHKNYQHEGYDKKLHAARFVVGLLVANTLHGGSFWLMIPIYDDRYRDSGFSCKKCKNSSMEDCRVPISIDDPGIWSCGYDGTRSSLSFNNYPRDIKQGSQHLIFRVPTSAFSRDIFGNEWSHHEMDLMPYLKAGIEAHQQHELHERNKKKEIIDPLMFYNVKLMTIGWEITGLNHAAIELKNLSLKGTQ